jgi:hypothetical protein
VTAQWGAHTVNKSRPLFHGTGGGGIVCSLGADLDGKWGLSRFSLLVASESLGTATCSCVLIKRIPSKDISGEKKCVCVRYSIMEI